MTHVTRERRKDRIFNGSGDGSGADVHKALARFNQERFAPAYPGTILHEPGQSLAFHQMEIGFMETVRAESQTYLSTMPDNPADFIAWFATLREWGPGQNDRLFPWLAEKASFEEMKWFLRQEVAGEAGFEDLLALTQVKMPTRVKLEMARNYWDEMGRGREKGMHGPMLRRLARHFDIRPDISSVVSESLALANMMSAMAFHRQYAFHAVGALGVIELTAPGRSQFVRDALARLNVPTKVSHYFALHAVLDVKHFDAWNAEVIAPLVLQDFKRARCIAEGAVMRLLCGLRCFEAYRAYFGI
jgi:hypothetical protein